MKICQVVDRCVVDGKCFWLTGQICAGCFSTGKDGQSDKHGCDHTDD